MMRRMKSILFVYWLNLKIFQSKEEDLLKEFDDIMKINHLHSSKIRFIVGNLCDKNVKFITKLSNIINVEGIIIKQR